jgi:hypothetical protein
MIQIASLFCSGNGSSRNQSTNVLKVQQGVFETYLITANKMSEEGH